MEYKPFKHCGLDVALNILSGKWKAIILYHLFYREEMRFTELWRIIPKVAKKVLLDHLKEMEKGGLVIRREINIFPPEVYYQLSEKGKALGPALSALELWANVHAEDEVKALQASKIKTTIK